jgi:plasmid maintenance system antidote protein VapI
MSYKKLSKKFSPEELADAFVFPVKLTAKQKKEAAEQLAAARKRTQAEMNDETKFSLTSFHIRFRIEDYLEKKDFDPELTFGSFLKLYIELLEKKRKEFAEEISIDETLLSQLINGHRYPPDYIAIRLEIYSDNKIPATLWLQLVEKQRIHEIATNKELRKKEKPFVRRKEPMKKTTQTKSPQLVHRTH